MKNNYEIGLFWSFGCMHGSLLCEVWRQARNGGEAPLEIFSPFWKNVLDVV